MQFKSILPKEAEIVMFMGQSNMSGIGRTSDAFPESYPVVPEGVAYEYPAISCPDYLVSLIEPFGFFEDNPLGIDDHGLKSGSLVSAFVNSYYKKNGNVPIIGISASAGGSSISQWQLYSSEGYLADAISRFKKCLAFCDKNHIKIIHKSVLWCQGETDCFLETPKDLYFSSLRNTFDYLKENGFEHFFIINIGKSKNPKLLIALENMNQWQEEFALNEPDTTMVANNFQTMLERGLMYDDYHYFQQAYNEVGTCAGNNMAKYYLSN